MSIGPDQAFDLPHGLTEADLVDLADGRLAPEREAVVLSAIRAQPKLGMLVRHMRDDLAALAAIGIAQAPTGLAEGIESRLEAAAVRDLAIASHGVPEAIPISRVVVRRAWPVGAMLESVWTRRLAVAAMLAIVGAGAVIGVRRAARSWGPVPSGSGAVAVTTTAENEVAAPGPEHRPGATSVASSTPAHYGDAGAISPSPGNEPPVGAELTMARAAQLAAEGRLAVTLRTGVADPTIKRLDALARRYGPDEAWRAMPLIGLPGRYAFLLTPEPEAPGAPGPVQPGHNPPVVAGVRPVSPSTPSAPPAAPVLPPLRRVVKAIYTVDVPPGEAALSDFVRSLSGNQSEGVKVALRELAEPVEAEIAVDPESVFWWSAAPNRWARRLSVPVVVEGLE